MALITGGGRGSIPAGTDSPYGVVTPSGIGALYIDSTHGTLYIATGVTNTAWIVVGGTPNSMGDVPGVSSKQGETSVLGGVNQTTPLNGTGPLLSDAYAQWTGNGAGLWISGNGVDGQQQLWWSNDAGGFALINDHGTVSAGAGGMFFPSSDPHRVGAWWDNAGTLTRSAG